MMFAAFSLPLAAHVLLCKWMQSSSDVVKLCCLQVPVLYPFGHGLSYSSFEYQRLQVTQLRNGPDSHTLAVQVRVKNTGEGARTGWQHCVRLACLRWAVLGVGWRVDYVLCRGVASSQTCCDQLDMIEVQRLLGGAVG